MKLLIVSAIAALVTLVGWLIIGFNPYAYLWHLLASQ